MEFRRVDLLPPYAFAEVNRRKADARRAGIDVIDLGFGNPDIPSPDVAVDTLREAALSPVNHRYSASRGIDDLRAAIAGRYLRRFGVALDPETEVLTTIGAKEGLAHLMWALLEPGDLAVVPDPSYPIHIFAPVIAGAATTPVPVGRPDEYFEALTRAFGGPGPRPKVIIVSFPHNPTTVTVEPGFFEDLVDFAGDRGAIVVHDFAYADIAFDGHQPPSLLQVPGAKEVGVELYSMTKGHSMAGWRVGFMLGNPEVVAALAKLKSYLDYGTFQPVQIAATATLDAGDDFVEEVAATYQRRRDVLVDGLLDSGWKLEQPKGTMFVWAEIPGAYEEMGSQEFTIMLLERAGVAVSPGAGFGPAGEGHVRFALVEDETRLSKAVDRLSGALDRL